MKHNTVKVIGNAFVYLEHQLPTLQQHHGSLFPLLLRIIHALDANIA
jgi:hypothetical protein